MKYPTLPLGILWHAKQDAFSIVADHHESLDTAWTIASQSWCLSQEQQDLLALDLMIEFPEHNPLSHLIDRLSL